MAGHGQAPPPPMHCHAMPAASRVAGQHREGVSSSSRWGVGTVGGMDGWGWEQGGGRWRRCPNGLPVAVPRIPPRVASLHSHILASTPHPPPSPPHLAQLPAGARLVFLDGLKRAEVGVGDGGEQGRVGRRPHHLPEAPNDIRGWMHRAAWCRPPPST